ncbi:protein-disulfide reductase DsbD family protein [Tahibacter harae]|uniref:Thioredoxin family protein n=1 Tax=Tahibacter harae TaxID=2963937 RepID=A0ABT1QUN5_9GAMM|nr:protein-disulfide reductase DsbD domain-containing protein [Tahibacter harae]MCQ4165981.1 thioredoxin family protein [Tahibacter harae]
MPHSWPRLLSLIGLAALSAGAVQAAPLQSEHLAVELVAERQALVAGAANWVGLRLEHEEHWHTYWQNAGDTGLPTRFEWTLPPGWKAGPIAWPAPERLQIGDLFNFGYSGTALLPVAIEVPAAAAGTEATVRLAANWLVCKEECIPGKAELTLTLPVAAAAAAPADSPAAAAVRAALARRPVAASWKAAVSADGERINIRVQGADLPAADALDVFALQPQVLANAPAQIARDGAALVVNAARSEYFVAAPAALDLVFVERRGEALRAWQVAAPWPAAAAAAGPAAAETAHGAAPGEVGGLGIALLLAFLGGIVLNLMPCVFPVLSLKALGLAESAHAPAAARRDGLAYLAGAVSGFLVLAAVLLALRAAGQSLGWGFQLQSPLLVAALAYLMVAMGLSLSGAFVIGARLMGVGQSLAGGGGARGAFFTGVLACVVASPCTAPFMGPALGFALTQPAAAALAVFAALGAGLALPIVALSFIPLLARWLPRPGAWMETFKQVMAWPLYVTAVWLFWVLMRQVGADAAAVALLGLVALIAALLYHGRSQLQPQAGWGRRLVFAALLLLALAPLSALTTLAVRPGAEAGAGQAWQTWTPQRFEELQHRGEPVFVNMTAAWCITCLANERIALSSEDFAARLRRDGIHYLKGDWTNQDAAITRYLANFQRSGVPLYVVYPRGGGAPEVLPQLLTPGLVDAALARAAASPSPSYSTSGSSP